MDRVWLKSGVALAAAILLGRLAGLFRELLIAHYYGADRTTDQLILFLTIPDVFTNMLAGGAMLYVLVPEFARQTPDGRRLLFRRASGYGLAGFGCLAILIGLIFPDRLLELIAPGFTSLERQGMQAYVAIFALMIPLTGVASITTSFLHARGSFALASMGTVIVNLCIIAGLILSTKGTGNTFVIVGLALLAGGLLRYGSQILVLRKVLSGSSAGAPQSQISDGLARQYAKALLGGGLFLLLPVIARALASDHAGEIAILNYTLKLAELPLGVAVGIIPFLLLPRMALAHAAGEREQARALNRNSLYANMSLSLAIGLPAAWFSSTVVDLLFGWGSLSSAKLAMIASLATITLATMPFQGILGHFMAALNASRQAGATVIVSMACLVIFLSASIILKAAFGLWGVVVALSMTYLASWILFSAYCMIWDDWDAADCGLSIATLMLLCVQFGLAVLFISIAGLFADTAILHVVWGGLWCGSALAASLVLHRILSTPSNALES